MKRIFTALAIASAVLTLSSVAPAESRAGERDGALAYSLVHGLKLLHGQQYNVAERRDGHTRNDMHARRDDRDDGFRSRERDGYRDGRHGHRDYRDDRGHRRHGQYHRHNGGRDHGHAWYHHGKRWDGHRDFGSAWNCHRTSKIVLDRYGHPLRIGGLMCFDRHGRPYIADGSRYVITRR